MLRQALVNNRFFAHLSVKHEFSKYLKYEDNSIFKQLTEYTDLHEKYPPDNAYFGTESKVKHKSWIQLKLIIFNKLNTLEWLGSRWYWFKWFRSSQVLGRCFRICCGSYLFGLESFLESSLGLLLFIPKALFGYLKKKI